MAVSRAGTNGDCGNLLLPEWSCCVGIRLVNSLFYTTAAPDWSHKNRQRRGVQAANAGVEGQTVRNGLFTKSSCCLKLRKEIRYAALLENKVFFH